MYCEQCGKDIKDNAKFCPYCGRAYTTVMSDGGIFDSVYGENRNPVNSSTKRKRVKKTIVFVALSMLAIVGALGVFFLNKSETNINKDSSIDIDNYKETPISGFVSEIEKQDECYYNDALYYSNDKGLFKMSKGKSVKLDDNDVSGITTNGELIYYTTNYRYIDDKNSTENSTVYNNRQTVYSIKSDGTGKKKWFASEKGIKPLMEKDNSLYYKADDNLCARNLTTNEIKILDEDIKFAFCFNSEIYFSKEYGNAYYFDFEKGEPVEIINGHSIFSFGNVGNILFASELVNPSGKTTERLYLIDSNHNTIKIYEDEEKGIHGPYPLNSYAILTYEIYPDSEKTQYYIYDVKTGEKHPISFPMENRSYERYKDSLMTLTPSGVYILDLESYQFKKSCDIEIEDLKNRFYRAVDDYVYLCSYSDLSDDEFSITTIKIDNE